MGKKHLKAPCKPNRERGTAAEVKATKPVKPPHNLQCAVCRLELDKFPRPTITCN